MATFRERLDALTDDERRLLQYAFEQQIDGQFVTLPNNKFIGVNVQHVRHLQVEESIGCWAYGTIKSKGTVE